MERAVILRVVVLSVISRSVVVPNVTAPAVEAIINDAFYLKIDDYEPERIDGQTNSGRVAKIVPGDDGILRLKLSNVDTFDNRCAVRFDGTVS